MPPKKRKAPRGKHKKRQVKASQRAVREARATMEVCRVEEQESAPGGDQDVEMSYSGPLLESVLTRRPIIVKDLVAVIIGVLHQQQAQLQPPPPPPVVRTPVSIIIKFCKISPSTFTREGDPILASR